MSGESLPLELMPGSHVCWVDADPDNGMPAHYRPCPADLCEATWLHNLICELREEFRQRLVCLEGARDDLARIAKAETQDGGVWLRAVAEARVPLVEAAITETNRTLVVLENFNVHI